MWKTINLLLLLFIPCFCITAVIAGFIFESLSPLGFSPSPFFFLYSRFGDHMVIIAGWASNSNYSLLGGLLSLAHTISYEVHLGLILYSSVFPLCVSFLAWWRWISYSWTSRKPMIQLGSLSLGYPWNMLCWLKCV